MDVQVDTKARDVLKNVMIIFMDKIVRTNAMLIVKVVTRLQAFVTVDATPGGEEFIAI